MPSKFISLDAKLYDYVIAHGHNHDPLLSELAEQTERELGAVAGMQISPEQGTFMALLAQISGARNAVEVGTFTGYSALCVARALPRDGKLLCCDVNETWTQIAQRYWERAGVRDRITLKLAPALETLRALPAEPSFDFAFIDADKSNYRNYYEEILKRTRTGGIILIDNVLWNGEVLNSSNQSADTRAIRDLNDFVVQDDRVAAVMLPIADGLTLCRKH